MLPAEMLPCDMNRTLPGTGLIRQGSEFDCIGRRVAYHFLRRHPGDLNDSGLAGETVRVPAGDVIHALDRVEADQLRGMSRFASAIVKLFTLDLYEDGELERKKIAAMFAMFITSPAPQTPLEPTEEDLEVEPAKWCALIPAWALIGFFGSDDFRFKVSPDGSAFFEALKIDRSNGQVELSQLTIPTGLSTAPSPPPAGKASVSARRAVNKVTGAVFEQKITADLPANTQFLSPTST